MFLESTQMLVSEKMIDDSRLRDFRKISPQAHVFNSKQNKTKTFQFCVFEKYLKFFVWFPKVYQKIAIFIQFL